MRKNEVDTDICNRRNRPHAYYKCFSYLQIPRIAKKFGYGYESTQPVLKELKESFEDKCRQYFSGARVEKLGRRDKHELKERLGFEMKCNPVQGMFQKLNCKLVAPLLKEALSRVKEASEMGQ
jgi:hypothetical protein